MIISRLIFIVVWESQIESNELFEKAFNTLIRASVDKRSDARNVVVSISDGEYPSSRIMVLREVNVRINHLPFLVIAILKNVS